MGAAAGAGVGPGKGDDAHPAGEGLLAAVLQDLQLLGGGKGDLNGVVLPDVAVGRLLQLLNLLWVSSTLRSMVITSLPM